MWGDKNLSSEAAFPGKRLVLIRGCFTNGIFFLPLMSPSFIPEDSVIDRAGAYVWWTVGRRPPHRIPGATHAETTDCGLSLMLLSGPAWFAALPVQIIISKSLEFHSYFFTIIQNNS